MRGRAIGVLGPRAPRLLRDRERRVVVYGLGAIAIALAATYGAPALLLALGPLVLGVPHLVADVRYLVVRPGLHRRVAPWIAIAGPACAAWVAPHAFIALLAPIGAAAVARAPIARRALVAFGVGILVVVAIAWERPADLVLAHAHNVTAVLLFVVWSRRRTQLHLLVVVAFVGAAAAIALGAFDGAPFARLYGSTRLDAGLLVETVAPLGDPRLATRALLVFAFAQSVHYAVWLRLVPEEDRPRPGLRSFSSSVAALRADLGAVGFGLAVLVSFALLAWAVSSLAAARDGYLRLAAFHGPLEMGAAALLLLESGHITARQPGSLGPWTRLRRQIAPATSAET